MAQQPMYAAAVNSPQTELAADVTASATSITVVNAAVLPPAPNLLTIGVDETAETVRYTAVNGNVLTVERAFQGVAKAWSAGAKVARYFTAYDHDAFRGNIAAVNAQLAEIEQENIIDNGDFDIWQKGTQATNMSGIDFIADRWIEYRQSPDGSPTTITSGRRRLQNNEIDGCKFFYRVEWNDSESSMSPDFRHMLYQVVDEGYSRYARAGNKITIKFLARTNIPNKRIAVNMHERYLSNNIYNLNGASFEIGNEWTEISYTWDLVEIDDTPTNDEDSFAFQIYFAWGTHYAARFEGIPESYRNLGWVDIANVRVVEGDIGRKTRKKSFNEELANCKRYFQKSWNYSDPVGSAVGAGWDGGVFSSNEAEKTITLTTNFEVEMFSTPTVVLYDTVGTKDSITTKNHLSVSTFGAVPNPGVSFPGTKNFKLIHGGTISGVAYHWTATVLRS